MMKYVKIKRSIFIATEHHLPAEQMKTPLKTTLIMVGEGFVAG
jgi:hypothetical protein